MAEEETSLISQLIAVSVTISLFVGIWAILRSRGARVVLSASLFVAFLVATQLSVKVIESPPYRFRFPGLLTTLHFSCVPIACAVYWTWVGEPYKILPCSIPPWRWAKTVLPVAVSQPISVVLNNKAMVYAGAGVCAVIGTLSPVCTALISNFCGRSLSGRSWLGVLVAFVGAAIISWGEVTQVGEVKGNSRVLEGLLYAFASLTGRCAKIVILDYMMAPFAYTRDLKSEAEEEEPLSVIHVLSLTYPWGAVLALAYALASGERPLEAWNQLTPQVTGFIVLSCSFALALNFLGTFALRDLGASAQQIVGKLNTICLASISVAFLGEHLPAVVVLGSGLVLSGVAIFERGQHDLEDDEDSSSSDDEEFQLVHDAEGKGVW